MKKSILIVVGVVSLLGITACSNDSTSVKQSDSTSATTSVGGDATGTSDSASTDTASESGGGTVGSTPDLSGASIPAGLGACGTYLSAFAGAVSGQDADLGNISNLFDALNGKVPADLNKAVKVLSTYFAKLQKLYTKYGNDFSKIGTDPEFTTLISDPAFADASAKFSTWIEAGCPMS